MPISAFAKALHAFHSGALSQDELSWEIDRQLAIEKASPVALLEVLKIQQVADPLPDEAHQAIVQHLSEWPDDPTIATGLDRKLRHEHPPGVGVGDILKARFSLVALLGEGGMSRVFKAVDLKRVGAAGGEHYIAVKVLTEPYGEYFGSILALQRETDKLKSLAHPNIVRVIDCDRDSKTLFMTMEYLDGESLQKKLRGRGSAGFETAVAVELITGIGNALEYAHGNNIVHGDLKPGNIIVTDGGVPKVIDFGMARFIARPQEGVAAESGEDAPKAVTARYASPEMAAGRDPETTDDVYALACIAYETLSGRHPFGRHGDLRARNRAARLPRPQGMRRQHHAALVRALAFDRNNRTPSVREFLRQLHAPRRPDLRTAWVSLAVLAAGWAAVGLYHAPRPGGRDALPRAVVRPAKALPGSVFNDCPNCPSMTVVPAGRFAQGGNPTPESLPFEQPLHDVIIAHPFAIATHEVTIAEFREFAAAEQRDMSGCNVYDGRWRYQKFANWESPGFAQDKNHPVTCVSWADASAYALWLSAKSGHVYRLPSASEWEYAARAGNSLPSGWGADETQACAVANVADRTAALQFRDWNVFPCDDHYANTAPVGSFRANAFGIHDMLGNVFEWVTDCWHNDYFEAPTDGAARLDGPCDEREMRGGSWFTTPRYVTFSYRNRFPGTYRSNTVGFRLVREVSE